MIVGNGFNVRLDDGSTDFVVSGAWSFFLGVGEEGFTIATALKRSATMHLGVDVDVEILSGAYGIGKFAGLVDFSLGFEDEGHILTLNFII